jgi:hypothetical protein
MAQMHCMTCGTDMVPRSQTRGSILIEILLWLCFLVPRPDLFPLAAHNSAPRVSRLRVRNYRALEHARGDQPSEDIGRRLIRYAERELSGRCESRAGHLLPHRIWEVPGARGAANLDCPAG